MADLQEGKKTEASEAPEVQGAKKTREMGDEKISRKNAGILSEAMKDCGIDAEYLVASRICADGSVVLVTAGGKKVRWVEGGVIPALSRIDITGINPKNDKRKPIAGKTKK